MQTMMRLLAASIVPLALLGAPLAGAAWGEARYGGLEKRMLKALSEQQIDDLEAGRGMSLALAAELNGYPGPTHVLENARALELTPRQQDLTKSLLEAMKREAIPLGLRLIEQEATLDDLFASKEITPSKLVSETEAIALTQARLRQTHLKYHLSMMQVLSPEQISRYQELRGYSSRQGMPPHQHKHN